MKPIKLHLSQIFNPLFKGNFSFATFALVIILAPVMAHALTPVTVAWDENNPVPAGYILYWGTSSGIYTDSHDTGNATQYTVPDLQEGVTYYFAAKAYDADGKESDYSAEISHTVATPNSSPTTPSVPTGPATGYIQTEYNFNSTATDPEDDPLEFQYDWGDSVISDWGNSTQSHSWSNTGTYCIKARAKDSLGAISGWSTCDSINIGINIHTIEASAQSNGSITPSGSVVVNDGNAQTFIITPDEDYQILEVRVDGTLIGTASSYTFNNVNQDHTITASFVYVDPNPVDTDGDGVPDTEDTFPLDPNETTDTDNDGTGNNADLDDDNDGMPDAWEIVNNLNPLIDDADADPDSDGISNIDEYSAGTSPHTYEDHSAPYAPTILLPLDNEIVSLTPELTTEEFYDPNVGDFHAGSRWQIVRRDDRSIVFDQTSDKTLTSITIPKLVLDEDTTYEWQVRFIDNHGATSEWSQTGVFLTDFDQRDGNGNGIPDHQEVDASIDLDEDGIPDTNQDDIKCVYVEDKAVQIGVSIKNSASIQSIETIESENPENIGEDSNTAGKPQYLPFGLLNFKLIVDQPGDEVEVTIYLSEPAPINAIWYKYDPINKIWQDYSEYTDISADRKSVYLTLTDGGFGDADGTENSIIIDPVGLGVSSDDTAAPTLNSESSGSSSGCFISATNHTFTDRTIFRNWKIIISFIFSMIFLITVLLVSLKSNSHLANLMKGGNQYIRYNLRS